MADFPVPAEAIEIAARAIHAYDWRDTTKTWDDRSVIDPAKDYKREAEWRLASRWFPVKP